MGDLGLPELLFILAIALLIFGPKKLGSLGKGLGEGIRNFKDGLRGPEPPPAPAAETTEVKPPTGEPATPVPLLAEESRPGSTDAPHVSTDENK